MARLVALAALVAACGGSTVAPPPAPSAGASSAGGVSASAVAPGVSATAAALASHPVNPAATVAATVTATGSAAASADASPPDAYPNPDESVLLAHIDAALRAGCARADQFYADELDSISCGGDPFPFVDYTLFATVDELQAAFSDDVAQSESQPTATGTCATATYVSSYMLEGVAAGRIQCTTRTANGQTFRVIEWTREELRTLAYLSSATATWTDMIAFWKAQAGPAN